MTELESESEKHFREIELNNRKEKFTKLYHDSFNDAMIRIENICEEKAKSGYLSTFISQKDLCIDFGSITSKRKITEMVKKRGYIVFNNLTDRDGYMGLSVSWGHFVNDL